jgi:hypothetical protein
VTSSPPSDVPSRRSKGHWVSPRSAMDFASQANRVATMILNGEIDLETARAYSAVARTVAQAMGTEVNRARISQIRPYLTLDETGGYEEADDGEEAP